MKIYDNKGAVLLDIEVDDTSYRYKAINGDNSLTLKFSLAEHVEVPLGAFCQFKNEIYSLMLPEDLTLRHRRNFEYTLVMYSEDYKARRFMFINPIDGRLKFSLTAKPQEHLQMYVDNMNMRDSGWVIGECPDHVEIVLSYNHTFCHDALVQLASELELDYWFDYTGGVKKVSLGKLELNKDNPLPLSYGGDGEGLKADIKRTNYDDALPIEILYVQGSSENIDPSKYKVDGKSVNELHLPLSSTIGYDGVHFDDEEGYDKSRARHYKTDDRGLSVRRADKDVVNHSEDSLDCSEITATREEKVEGVWHVDREKHFFDIAFYSDVDYSQYQIGGEKPTIVFQKGMLAGKEFDIATEESGKILFYDEQGMWRMEIVPQDIDGITMPDTESGYVPVEGDTFKFFGIQLPTEYIAEAEMEMLRYAIKHLYANEDVQYTISGTLDEIYANRDWENIEGRLSLGNYVAFSDKSFQSDPLLIRIIGIKDYVNKPHSPILEISNATVVGSIIGTLNRLENQEAYTEKLVADSKKYTKRSFADAKRSIKMLEAAFGDSFEESISPATIQTMMMVVGHESLQFQFLDSDHAEFFDVDTKTFKCAAGTLKHFTIGIKDIRPKYDQQYRQWSLPFYESAVLSDVDKEYYVYAVVDKEGTTGKFRLEEKHYNLEQGDKYYLLLGLLLPEFEGSRSYVSLYGFTEVLPGQITTDVLRSGNGNLVIDLANALITAKDGAKISGDITIGSGSSGLANLSEWSDKQKQIDDAQAAADNTQKALEETAEQLGKSIQEVAEIVDSVDAATKTLDTKADQAIEDAADAMDAAEKAQEVADSAKKVTDALNDDGIFTLVEKRGIRNALKEINPSEEDHVITRYYELTAVTNAGTGSWSEITDKADEDYGWYVSDMHSHNAYAIAKVTFNVLADCSVTMRIKAKSETQYDYVMLGDLDGTQLSTPTYTSSDIVANTMGKAAGEEVQHTFHGVEKGEHSVYVYYRKNLFTSEEPDNGYFRLDASPYLRGSLGDYLALCEKKGIPGGNAEYYANDLFFAMYHTYKVWENSNTDLSSFEGYREQMMMLFQYYYSSILEIQQSITQSDYDYLTQVFGKGNNLNVEGVVMSQMVAVRSEENKVKAFLNGSDLGRDSEHGKLLIGAGVDDITKPEETKTRIYEDGTIISPLIKMLNGCRIGESIRIEDDKIVIDLASNGMKMTLSEQGLMTDGYSSATIGNCGGAAVQGFANGMYAFCPTNTNPIGVQGEAKSGDYAFYSSSGMFAGLRPKTRVITTGGTSGERIALNVLDYSVLVTLTTGACYLGLPSAPQDGQEYHIETHGCTLSLRAANSTWMAAEKRVVPANNSFSVEADGIVRLKFYKQINQWQCSVM